MRDHCHGEDKDGGSAHSQQNGGYVHTVSGPVELSKVFTSRFLHPKPDSKRKIEEVNF